MIPSSDCPSAGAVRTSGRSLGRARTRSSDDFGDAICPSLPRLRRLRLRERPEDERDESS